MIIKPQFDSVDLFSDGMADIEVDGKYGFINKNSKIIVETQCKLLGWNIIDYQQDTACYC